MLLLLFCLFAQPVPTIDNLIDKVLDLRKQKAELEKAETAALLQLQTLLAEQQKRIDELGMRPKPPDPVPKPDKLVEALKAAHKMDADAGKGTKEQLASLASLWKMAGELALQKNSKEFAIESSADLMAAIRKAAITLNLPTDTVFPALRKQIGAEVFERLGEEVFTPFTDEQREQSAALFKKIGEVLSGF